MKHIITDPSECQTRPEDIDVTGQFFEAFGETKTEASAHWVVKLCQQKGDWLPFTKHEINALYNEGRDGAHQRVYSFNRLIPQGYVVERDGKYFVTTEFVTACYESRPATPA